MIRKVSSLVCLTLVSSMAAAQNYESNDGWRLSPEFSIGAGYGATKIKDSDDDFDEDEGAKKAFAVVKFNEYIGLEGAYIDFDEAGNDELNFDATGGSLALILEAPVSKYFSLYAKGGQIWWDADSNFDVAGVEASDSYDGDDTFWGVGTKIRLAEHLDLRVEYERFNFDISRDEIDLLQPRDINMDVDLASVNLQFTF